MNSKQDNAGFTTIELLVALAILASGFFALIEFKLALLDRQAQHMAQFEAITAESNALAVLRQINPANNPSGDVALGNGIRLEWRSKPTTHVATQLAWLGRETEFRVARFNVHYIVKKNDAVMVRDTVELLGRSRHF